MIYIVSPVNNNYTTASYYYTSELHNRIYVINIIMNAISRTTSASLIAITMWYFDVNFYVSYVQLDVKEFPICAYTILEFSIQFDLPMIVIP